MIRALLAWLGLALPVAPSGVCRCGHTAEMHEHWRAGDDCGTCGRAVCDRYRDTAVTR